MLTRASIWLQDDRYYDLVHALDGRGSHTNGEAAVRQVIQRTDRIVGDRAVLALTLRGPVDPDEFGASDEVCNVKASFLDRWLFVPPGQGDKDVPASGA